MSPAPRPARIETAYVREPGYAERYRDARFRTGSGPRTDRRERRAITKLLRACAVDDGPWLDVPCGAGRLSDLLPGPVVQVDRDPAMVRAVERTDTTKICASAHALPFADATFAGALCMRLLQHIPNGDERVRVLSELRRVTRGPIVMSFFHAASFQHARRVVSRRLRRKPVSGRSAVTLRRFFAELQRAGLEPVRCAPLLPFLSDQWVVLARPRHD
ncbi:MAG: class I SAM-dependent methyltransferase [Planctomycetota bacterium]|nr:class I SAM-dependent methyltransferase [Planctomycetota bacterium]MDA0933133.1 class I SAM-dependent methyltransferase [Planctomycetota bacterium]MDA1221968.1 class I SAM-dependent methyltransferase [Planctomycetota bacterium]